MRRSGAIIDFCAMKVIVLNMKSGRLKNLIAVMVLVSVVFLMTGAQSYVSAASLKNTETPCCDECNKDENQTPANCSTPACPHFLCLSINMASPFTLSVAAENVYLPKFAEELSLKSIPRPIFHPPTIS